MLYMPASVKLTGIWKTQGSCMKVVWMGSR
jgi:hypothetical protein